MANSSVLTSRARHYEKSRPGYPIPLFDFLKAQLPLCGGRVIADIGSGTGFFADFFLQRGLRVFAVEPDDNMRIRAGARLVHYPGLQHIRGTAESTTLPGNSIDIITVAQALHLFDIDNARKEFARIVRQDGFVVVVWNARLLSSPFACELDALLKEFGKNREKVTYEGRENELVSRLFGSAPVTRAFFHNWQVLYLQGLIHRVASISYIPLNEQGELDPVLVAKLIDLHARHEFEGGKVSIEYTTLVYVGQLTK